MRICIIGGGNIGTAMAIMAANSGKADVVILTSDPQRWHYDLVMTDHVLGKSVHAQVANITSDYEQAVNGSDMILITHPSFLVPNTLEQVSMHLKKPSIIGIIPGTGGAEFAAQKLLQSGHIFFGVDRVPCISRVTEYGKSVDASFKKSVRLCAIPGKETERICSLFSYIFGVGCFAVRNYLTITLTPSNPILHTSRLFALCQSHSQAVWAAPPMFYQDWDDASSELLLQCDVELQELCGALSDIPLDVIPLRIHYEADTVQAMTQKLRSLSALKSIPCPMMRVDGGYALDLASRYFTEDFPYGLCILKGFAAACRMSVPHMDMILRWYESMAGVQYFSGDYFCGSDLQNTGIPQNYGIHTVSNIYRFYVGIGQ